jgi:O-antigen ligase
MTAGRRRDRAGDAVRVGLLVLLALAPLLVGAVYEVVFVPLLVGCALAGLFSAWRARRARAGWAHVPEIPAWRVLVAAHVLVLLQLLPLPPRVLRVVSPGSFSFYNDPLLFPLAAWKPISVSPPDTLRGLAFLAGFSLLYASVFLEFRHGQWRRRLVRTVIGVGLVMTVVAFVQDASADPRRIWGVFHPRFDWGVFGPYINASHFAGYVGMAALLGIGAALENLDRLRHAWTTRRRGWLALGGREGNAFVRAVALVMVLVAGLVASRSRGAASAFALTLLLLPLAARRRRRTALAVVLLAGLGVAWIGLGGIVGAFEARGVRSSRLDLWADMLPMVPRFPVFGLGLNAFASAYPWYQTYWPGWWIGQAHNEYLQALLDGGIVGLGLLVLFLATVFRAALRGAALVGLEIGLFGALLMLALHNLVDFNWQIPANAATWVALAALALNGPAREASFSDALNRAALGT